MPVVRGCTVARSRHSRAPPRPSPRPLPRTGERAQARSAQLSPHIASRHEPSEMIGTSYCRVRGARRRTLRSWRPRQLAAAAQSAASGSAPSAATSSSGSTGAARPRTRCDTTSARVTPWRNRAICRPSSCHRSWVWQRSPAAPGRRAGHAPAGAGLTARRLDRLLHGVHDIGHRDRVGRPRQAVAAARPARRGHQAGTAQLAEQLFEISQAQLLAAGDLGQADRAALTPHRLPRGEIRHGHHRIAPAGGELHR